MGISHPLFEELYGGPRGGLGLGGALLLSPDRTPSSCCSPVDGQEGFPDVHAPVYIRRRAGCRTRRRAPQGWRRRRHRRLRRRRIRRRQGAGQVPARRQHQPHHEEGHPDQRQDCQGRQGDRAGGERQVPEGEAQDQQRRRPALGYGDAGV